MWRDTNKQARRVAAQTLGRTGRGARVHDEILARLSSSVVTDRIDALEKIAHTGVMTTMMLEPFLKCFHDDYIKVRELACNACQFLVYGKNNEKLIDALVFMVRFDRSAKLKILAIRSILILDI